jgi:prophage regulatory protein
MTITTTPPRDRLLLKPDVCKIAGGVRYETVWRWIKAGQFPQPVRLNAHRIAWRESELMVWLEGLEHGPAASPAAAWEGRRAKAAERRDIKAGRGPTPRFGFRRGVP